MQGSIVEPLTTDSQSDVQTSTNGTAQNQQSPLLEGTSSFQRCMGYVSTIERRLADIGNELTTYGESIVRNNTIIIITNTVVEPRLPSFVRLIINIFLYLLRNFSKGRHHQQLAAEVAKQPEKITLRSSLWAVIVAIVRRKLFGGYEPVLYYAQLSSMIIFRQELALSIFTLIGHHEALIRIAHFIHFYEEVSSAQSMAQIVPGYVYSILGGSHLTINVQTFSEKIKAMSGFVAGYLNSDNLLIQYVKSITHKRKDKDNEALERYIFLVSDFRRSFSEEAVTALTLKLFSEETTIEKKLFVERVAEVLGGRNNPESSLLSILFELVRLEFYIVETDNFKKYAGSDKDKQDDQTKSRYYLESLDRLMSKCPFNGDERCSCKKCQCVRRNRESAKNSQQKKREAMEQIGPLTERIRGLEQRNTELEQENQFLRGLLANLHQHPNFYTVIRESTEALSKSLNNH